MFEHVKILLLDGDSASASHVQKNLPASASLITMVSSEHDLDQAIATHSPAIVFVRLIWATNFAAIAQRTRRTHPTVQFVLLTDQQSPALIAQALQQGAHGYLPCFANSTTYETAIERTIYHCPSIESSVAAALQTIITTVHHIPGIYEQIVLTGLADNQPLPDILTQLHAQGANTSNGEQFIWTTLDNLLRKLSEG